MEIVIFALLVAVGIVSLVCWIMTLIKIFQNGETVLGIIGIVCGIVAFIMGWVKVKEYNNQKVMVIWTIAIVISVILNIVVNAMVAASQ